MRLFASFHRLALECSFDHTIEKNNGHSTHSQQTHLRTSNRFFFCRKGWEVKWNCNTKLKQIGQMSKSMESNKYNWISNKIDDDFSSQILLIFADLHSINMHICSSSTQSLLQIYSFHRKGKKYIYNTKIKHFLAFNLAHMFALHADKWVLGVCVVYTETFEKQLLCCVWWYSIIWR